MKRLAIAFALAGCGGGSKPAAKPAEPLSNTVPVAEPAAPPPQTPTQRAMAKMRELEAAMCACRDADCAKHVSDDMTAWSQAEAKKQVEPPKMSDDDIREATRIGTHMGECMVAAMNAAAGSGSGAATP